MGDSGTVHQETIQSQHVFRVIVVDPFQGFILAVEEGFLLASQDAGGIFVEGHRHLEVRIIRAAAKNEIAFEFADLADAHRIALPLMELKKDVL